MSSSWPFAVVLRNAAACSAFAARVTAARRIAATAVERRGADRGTARRTADTKARPGVATTTGTASVNIASAGDSSKA